MFKAPVSPYLVSFDGSFRVADDKPYMRARVAGILVEALQSNGLQYPEPTSENRAGFEKAREELS